MKEAILGKLRDGRVRTVERGAFVNECHDIESKVTHACALPLHALYGVFGVADEMISLGVLSQVGRDRQMRSPPARALLAQEPLRGYVPKVRAGVISRYIHSVVVMG